jgi:hypothetical protein
MSDRTVVGGGCSRLVLACTIGVLLTGGCERTATTSPSHVQTVPADPPGPVAGAPSEPPAQAPLLLEEETAEEAPSESAADNSRCFVCHVNYLEEEIAVHHAQAGVSCATCHGPSDAHIADESWASGGNGTAPDRMYTRDKINAACMACHPKAKIDTPQHMAVLADVGGQQVCTDCHGKHRLPQRRCKWK